MKPIDPGQGEAPARILLRRTPDGLWIVRDEMDRRGGRFHDRRAALRFASREFGPAARIIDAAR